jgi:hypothetical protein
MRSRKLHLSNSNTQRPGKIGAGFKLYCAAANQTSFETFMVTESEAPVLILSTRNLHPSTLPEERWRLDALRF